jgi:uncharacterized protein (DUF2384 family)
MVAASIQNIPERISDSEVLHMLKSENINGEYISYVKEFSKINDELLSDWFNVNVKTFRNYKKQNTILKENLQEQVVLLISLYKHGIEVFGEVEDFNNWLDTENFFIENSKPISYLKTVTGIRFVDDRLTAMEYGDNI